MSHSLTPVRLAQLSFSILLVAASMPVIFAQARHPLDPLTADEIKLAKKVLAAAPGFPPEALFSTIVLKEPSKNDVINFRPGQSFTRQAAAVVMDRKHNRTFEALIDLNSQRMLSWYQLKGGAQPLVTDAEFTVLPDIVKADSRWQAAMRKRGITNFDQVQIDGWAVGQVAAAQQRKRLLRALSYLKADSINFYGRPIEGVVVLVDMNKNEVIEVVDTGVVPIAKNTQELDEKATGRREKPKPLVITQPDGVSFTIDGQEVRWQKWRFRYTMHPREGLVLHTVSYEDDGRLRSILYRGSLSEMVVPYGDRDENWRWRS